MTRGRVTRSGAHPGGRARDAGRVVVDANLQLGILGPLRVEVADHPASVAEGRRQALLALLALADGHPVTTTRLAEELLGSVRHEAAEATVRTYVSKLRGELGGAAHRVRTVRHGYALDLEPEALDAQRFFRLLARARAESDAHARLQQVSAALDLWRGAALADLSDVPGLRAAAEQLEESRIDAIRLCAKTRLEVGDFAVAARELRSVLSRHPHREDLAGLLMVALYHAGRQVDALLVYPGLRDRLVDDFGVEPGPEVSAIHAAILRRDESLSLVLPGATMHAAAQSSPGRLPILGRQEEVAALVAAHRRAGTGRSQVVLVRGEVGAGKSRLLAEFAGVARAAGALVLQGRAEGELGPPYQPLAECLVDYISAVPRAQLDQALGRWPKRLARLDPEVASRLGEPPNLAVSIEPQAERYLLFRAVADWLRAAAATRSVVLLLDDLDTADRPTAELIRHVVMSNSRSPMLVVAAVREDVLDDDHPITWLTSALRRHEAWSILQLRDLDVETISSLADSAGVAAQCDPDQVHSNTGGNAFLVTQVLAGLAAREPGAAESARSGVESLIHERLRQLPEATVGLLTAAAVAGSEATLGAVAAAAATTPERAAEALSFATRAGLLMEHMPGGYRFVHGLVREVLLARLGPTRRAWLHSRVADYLEARYSDRLDAVADELAYHHATAVVVGGDASRAVTAALRAGSLALRQLADETALARLSAAQEAVDRAGSVDPDLALELRLRIGETQRRLERAEYRETLLAVGERADLLGDTTRLVRAALELARDAPLEFVLQPDEQRIALVERALEVVQDQASRAVLMSALANELARMGRYAAARGLSHEAVAAAHESGDDPTLCRVFRAHTWLCVDSMPPAAMWKQSVEHLMVARRMGDPTDAFHATMSRAAAAIKCGMGEELDRCVAELSRLSQEIDVAQYRWRSALIAGLTALLRGRLTEAEDHAARTLSLGDGMPGAQVASSALRLGIRFHRGDPAELAEQFEALADRQERIPNSEPLIALFAAESGRTEEARAILTASLDATSDSATDGPFAGVGTAHLATLTYRLHEPIAAAALMDRLATQEPGFLFGGGPVWGHVYHYRALLGAVLGHPETDQLFAAAASAHEGADARPWLVRTQLAWARWLISCGRVASGRQLAEAAGLAARDMGLTSLALSAQAALDPAAESELGRRGH